MTTTYDPFHPKYFDEADLRQEMTRVYDLCHGCRLCFKLCDSFPTMFEYIDAHDDQDAAKLSAQQQDDVVDKCFNCKLCYVICPYTPPDHEWQLDFPRLMMRAEQVLFTEHKRSLKTKATDLAFGSTDLVGKVSTKLSGVTNKALGTPGSKVRDIVETAVGISSQRILPPYAKQRFSTWFNKRGAPHIEAPQAHAVLFPTCMTEYSNTVVATDTVKVYERNKVQCELPDGQVCCGAPFLHQGNLDKFRSLATKNIAVLADAIRSAKAEGKDDVKISVLQPTCSYVLKYDYTDYIGGPDAELVAQHTTDVAEFLMGVHKGEHTELDTGFTGEVPATTTYHAPCHLRAQNMGMKSRDLMKLTGTKLTVVAECSGIDGTWGLRAENMEMARGVAKKMAKAITKADSEVVAGDCTLANGGIELETGQVPQHPISLVARAYGIEAEA